MAAGNTTTRSLEVTPTWALATVCFVFISISILLEHSINLFANWLKRRRKTALIDAVEKLKSELMVLGFISLLLAVTQIPISKICIPMHVADTMLPCRKLTETPSKKIEVYETGMVRRLFAIDDVYEDSPSRPERRLAGADSISPDHCTSKNMVSLVGQDGIHQLHIFIFVLAVMQIVYSGLTMALGRAKMKRWKAWEKETQTTAYQVANDPGRFRFARQTTFGRRHMNSCTESSLLLWIKCFFRQFFHSVAKVDYLTLRHGFIAAHLSPNHAFNFQKYIQRSLEDDFKVVVGVSPLMWFIVVIFLLLDVHGWHVYLWLSFIPMIIVLLLGTKLEIIVARMALKLKYQSTVIIGAPLVEPNDELFWFGKPKQVLTFIHFTLFMNAFELSFFIWTWIEFGISSCYHEYIGIIIVRIVLAVSVQVLCSYITLPLYALVTQMGSQFKSAVLEEQIAQIMRKWHADVREQRKRQNGSSYSRNNRCNKDESSKPRISRFASPTPLLPKITQKEEIIQELPSQYASVSEQKIDIELRVL